MTAPTIPPVLIGFDDLSFLDALLSAFDVDVDVDSGSVVVTAIVDASRSSVGLLVMVDTNVVLSALDSNDFRLDDEFEVELGAADDDSDDD